MIFCSLSSSYLLIATPSSALLLLPAFITSSLPLPPPLSPVLQISWFIHPFSIHLTLFHYSCCPLLWLQLSESDLPVLKTVFDVLFFLELHLPYCSVEVWRHVQVKWFRSKRFNLNTKQHLGYDPIYQTLFYYTCKSNFSFGAILILFAKRPWNEVPSQSVRPSVSVLSCVASRSLHLAAPHYIALSCTTLHCT